MPENNDLTWASEAEVRSAMTALGSDDYARLTQWGCYLLFIYGRFANGREPEDLYQEAIARTLAKKRKWKPKNCTFVEHLMGAMKSIASHLPEKYGKDVRNVPMRGSDLADSQDEEGSDIDPIQNVGSETPSIEDALVAKEALDRIEKLMEDDEEAFNVLVLLAEGKTEPEIANELGLPRQKVHAAIERIRYRVSKATK